MWKDDNDNIEKLWHDFLNRTLTYPCDCPICGKIAAHIYLHRYKESKGTVWMWCSECKNCSHGTVAIPEWWVDDTFVELNKTASHPDYLETIKEKIDYYMNSVSEKTASRRR